MKRLILLAAASSVTTAAHALVWNESISGDLSTDPLAPTPLTLQVGVNTISGTMGRDLPSAPIDRDIFTFTLAPGQELTSIFVRQFDLGNQSFYAIAPGGMIDINSSAAHLSNTLVKTTGEILDDLALGAFSGGTGFTAPLGAGAYTIWFQELSSIVSYQFEYTVASVAPVPEPGTALAGGLLCLLAGASRVRLRRDVPYPASAAATTSAVFSKSAVVCARERNPASNCEGAK